MGIPLEISSVSALWPSSSLAAQGGTAAMPEVAGYLPLITALTAIVILAFFRHISYAVSGSILLLFTPGTHSDLNDGVSFNRAANITAMISVPAVSICLVMAGISRLSIIGTVIVTASYVFLQIIFIRIARFFNDEDAREAGLIQARSVFILFTLLCMPAAILASAFSTVGKSISCVYIPIVAAIAAVYYAISSGTRILKLRFSYFFTFLYLCGVQLLPLAATVKLLLD